MGLCGDIVTQNHRPGLGWPTANSWNLGPCHGFKIPEWLQGFGSIQRLAEWDLLKLGVMHDDDAGGVREYEEV